MRIDPIVPAEKIVLDNSGFVKMVLMLSVILCHSCSFWTGSWFSVYSPALPCKPLGVLANWLGSFHVFGFTLLSGFIYDYIRTKGGYQDMKSFLSKKCARLIFPYYTAALFWVIPITIFYYNYGVKDVLHKYMLGCGPSQLWFLLMLFDVFIIYRLIEGTLRRHSLLSVFILALFYVVGNISQAFVDNYFQLFTAFMFIPYFHLGVVMHRKIDLFFQFPRKQLYSAILVAIIIQFCLFIGSTLLDVDDNVQLRLLSKGLYILSTLIGAVISVIALSLLGDKIRPNNGFYQKLRDNNFTMFLLHQQIIYVLIAFFNGLVNPYVNALMNFVISLVVSLLLSILLHKSKTMCLLLGEKK